MKNEFNIGDHVRWNSEAGIVQGTIIRIHYSNVDFKGYTHHATEKEQQYEIKRDISDHIAAHNGSALTKI